MLGSQALTDPQVSLLTDWVQGGGNLDRDAPGQEAGRPAGAHRRGARAPTVHARGHRHARPGPASTARTTLQYPRHGRPLHAGSRCRDRHALLERHDGDLNPAVTLRRSGRAAARLPRSPTTWLARWSTRARATRPGRARSATARRPSGPTTSSSVRPGTPARLGRPDQVDVPQADEQQRLLANLDHADEPDRRPLPRFWYLPRGEKAAVVMTGDDHATGGTAGASTASRPRSPPGCSVADWECVRATSYIYADTPLTDAQATAFQTRRLRARAPRGTPAARTAPRTRWRAPTRDQLADFAAAVPERGRAAHQPHPLRRLERLGHAAQGRAAHGIRLDTNYYYWPALDGSTRPGCSPARASRSASPTSTARRSTSTRQ